MLRRREARRGGGDADRARKRMPRRCPAEAKHLNEPCFLHVDLDGTRLETVELPNGILIYRPSRTRSRHWKEGPSVSIRERDFLASSGMRLVVDLSHDEMYLEKV